jgi:hypothetical protein
LKWIVGSFTIGPLVFTAHHFFNKHPLLYSLIDVFYHLMFWSIGVHFWLEIFTDNFRIEDKAIDITSVIVGALFFSF